MVQIRAETKLLRKEQSEMQKEKFKMEQETVEIKSRIGYLAEDSKSRAQQLEEIALKDEHVAKEIVQAGEEKVMIEDAIEAKAFRKAQRRSDRLLQKKMKTQLLAKEAE